MRNSICRRRGFDRRVTAHGDYTLRGGLTSSAHADAVPRASDDSEVVLVEMVVMPDSALINNTAAELRLRSSPRA